MSIQVQFDRGPNGFKGTSFKRPINEIIVWDPQDLSDAFAQMQHFQTSGHWIAGFASYELGLALSPKLRPLLPKALNVPLCAFGVFDAAHEQNDAKTPPSTEVTETLTLRPSWNEAQYTKAFERVHDYICAGDIYQANLTFPLEGTFSGSCEALYAQLRARQTVEYGALLKWDNLTLLSRSPELFFSLSAHGELTARPMKGTAPRGLTDTEDAKFYQELYSSAKNRAENLMIVDLLRNDMSRISQLGSVKVPKLFEIEPYSTLHQMTSTITSQVHEGVTLQQIFEALFPCGSIVGAPKIRAMDIIHELECGQRGAYCGSLGWIAPSGAMEFNVAIRTLVHNQTTQALTLQVGGGIVYDSCPVSEYEEALLKSRFATIKS